MNQSALQHITVSNAASRLGVTMQTVRTMLSDGRLHGIRYGDRGWWKVDGESLERLACEGTRKEKVS